MTSNLSPMTDLNKRIAEAMGGVWENEEGVLVFLDHTYHSTKFHYTSSVIQMRMLEDLVKGYTHVSFANDGKMLTPSNAWEYDKHVTQHGLNLKESIALAWLAMKEEEQK